MSTHLEVAGRTEGRVTTVASRSAFRGTLSVRRGLLALATALALAAGGCGADDSTPVVVRGQVVYSARDGGGPYTFAGMYLRLDTVGWVTDQVVGKDGRFTLRVENAGDVRRYARLHGGTARFELVSDTTWGHVSCGSVPLPSLRLGEANGERAWLSGRPGTPLPPVTILISINGADRFRVGSGPERAPGSRGCPPVDL